MEPEWHAHYRCDHCNAVRPKTEIVILNGKHICRDGDCQDKVKAIAKTDRFSGAMTSK